MALVVTSAAAAAAAASSSTSLLDLWYSTVPQFVRFGTAASVGNIFFFAADILIYNNIVVKVVTEEWPQMLHRNQESVSFFLSYLVQISVQHLLNAWLVYGLDTIASKEKYWSTLSGSYAAYATTLVASTIMNGYLISIGWDKNVAFWATICGFGVINYLFLTWVVKGDEEGDCQNDAGKHATKMSGGAAFMQENKPGFGAKAAILVGAKRVARAARLISSASSNTYALSGTGIFP